MGAIELLMHQHREIEVLFEHWRTADSPGQRTWFRERIAERVRHHAAAEEDHLHPLLQRLGFSDEAARNREEHGEIDRLARIVLGLREEGPRLTELVHDLEVEVMRHIRDEEGNLFPELERLADPRELAQVGRQMEREGLGWPAEPWGAGL